MCTRLPEAQSGLEDVPKTANSRVAVPSAGVSVACRQARRRPRDTHGKQQNSSRRENLSAWNSGKVTLFQNFAMVKFVARDEVGERVNRHGIVAGHAAAQPRFLVKKTK